MGAGLKGMIIDDIEWPLPGFQGHCILTSGISRRWCDCTKHSCRSLGALPKLCKKLGSSLIFLLKALECVLHQWLKLNLTHLVLIETSMQTYSLSEEGFGYDYGRLKSSASHKSLNDGAKKWKKWRNLDIFAAWTASFRLMCVVRNVPCAVTYWAIPRGPTWSLQLAVDSNVWWAWQWLLFIVIECIVRR